jgi:hypothetical protein
VQRPNSYLGVIVRQLTRKMQVICSSMGHTIAFTLLQMIGIKEYALLQTQ